MGVITCNTVALLEFCRIQQEMCAALQYEDKGFVKKKLYRCSSALVSEYEVYRQKPRLSGFLSHLFSPFTYLIPSVQHASWDGRISGH